MTMFSINSHCDLDLGPRMLILKLVQDIVMINICVKFHEIRSINVGARVRTMLLLFFSKKSHCDLDLGHRSLRLKPI